MTLRYAMVETRSHQRTLKQAAVQIGLKTYNQFEDLLGIPFAVTHALARLLLCTVNTIKTAWNALLLEGRYWNYFVIHI